MEAAAPILHAGACILKWATRATYDALWAPVRAAPDVALSMVHPSVGMQLGRGGGKEWAAQDGFPGDHEAALSTGHLAFRVGGIGEEEEGPDVEAEGEGARAVARAVAREGASAEAREAARAEASERAAERRRRSADGVSNWHTDRIDSPRARGVPIIYVPHISPCALRRLSQLGCMPRPMPSSDLIWAENACKANSAGGRAVRVVTCRPGWPCIVTTHFESCLHGGVFPVGVDGDHMDRTTNRPWLDELLIPGVELVRAVCYQLREVDSWCNAVQAVLNILPAPLRAIAIRHVYEILEPPLDERFRMLHLWLEPKKDDDYSEPYGKRDQWQ